MNDLSSVSDKKAQQQLWIYLLPIVGIVPSIWTLYRGKASEESQKTSRLSLILVLSWSIAYISLFVSANQTSDILAFRLLYANALITTGYFLVCLGLMFRLLQGKSPYLPLVNVLSSIKTKKNLP
ncbi:MAG: hypothetical protein AAGA80_02920 [Cyanobacteria bacterium P01_F01_bin.143]